MGGAEKLKKSKEFHFYIQIHLLMQIYVPSNDFFFKKKKIDIYYIYIKL